tara:strand:- start:18 stop:530 length:513 start_codon:yes stop_codon:yes gene_type:complete
MAKKKSKPLTAGVPRLKPKSKKKNIGRSIGRKASKIFKPSRLLGIGGLALGASDIYDLASFSWKEREALGKLLSSSEGREDLMSGAGSGLKEELKDTLSFLKPPEWSKPYAKATKKRIADRKKPSLFNPTRKELLERSKRVVRKKGGRVGRPKGVGCATKGFGKAMKRGK